MSHLPIKSRIDFCYRCAWDWKTLPCSSVEIPPSDDALQIRFTFIKETRHAFGPSSDVLESFFVSLGYKVIIIRPSELCSEDTTSIMQSHSVRSILDFVNAYYRPLDKEIMRSKIVTGIIELVQNSIGSFPLPPDRIIVVERREKVEILHDADDQVMKARLLSCFQSSKRGTCDICFEDYEVGLDASRLPCAHVFHRACNAKWLAINHTCPVCRFSIPPEVVAWF